ncbi:L7Ae/L30e/S12e/Gadd45 family ribosomal protein [Alkalicoccus urumqiensis]|uniref:Ribosomal protein eL8/eL30/eS12/Gadd45 domain-containing protein n=1 Tax=Alkalicoccus urumqiensis TaxID=1548213 RepID=A0A2P6MG30_ALKUR|nr:ribosomal L7Ae/L30e/S12e/Gadd45 family protein [Alkalicoccus urumqiensis]PRO65190.1 hypothetical protein C6I21_10310 [Alkalicoccus urumqiensis]
MNRKQASLVGLMMRAGSLVTGEEQTVRTIQSGRAALVLLSDDASFQTEKRITNKCAYYQVPLARGFTRGELGQAVGKEERVSACVTDAGFADSYQRKAEQI